MGRCLITLGVCSAYSFLSFYNYTAKIIPFSPSEHRYRVAVIDTGIDFSRPELAPFKCEGGHASFDGLEVFHQSGNGDTNGHGSAVAWIVARGLDPKKVCLSSLRYSMHGPNNLISVLKAWKYIVSEKFDIVNYSGGGEKESGEETAIITNLLAKGLTLVVAAGNKSQNLDAECNFFPACHAAHPNFHVVGVTGEVSRLYISNYGKAITDYAYGLNDKGLDGQYRTGTSMAAGRVTHRLIIKNLDRSVGVAE